MQLISVFTPDTMLKFLHDVDKLQKLQFLSNRDPVKQGSKPGRQIVLFQGDKTKVVNKKDSILPIIEVR